MFSSQATGSPSKVTVPSRRQRNQPTSRVHDIEFATEISTSLLAQVRQLQAILAERDEALRATNLERSRLELEAEGYSQRLRVLDENEQRYKDENWNLETQTQELLTAVKEASDRESKFIATLNQLNLERSAVQRELDDLKQANARLLEESTAAQKVHDSEIHMLRRVVNSGDAEKSGLQKKLEELTSQNQELAKVVAIKFKQQEQPLLPEVVPRDDDDDVDDLTPENSPPTSPSKATPRHGLLESETLRSSLHHAHRMIQNLKNTIHREKTEKLELKRMLQDARDEVEQRRKDSAGPTSATKRQKTRDIFKKPQRLDMLGASRQRTTEIEIDDDWEDHSPTRPAAHPVPRQSQAVILPTDESSDYQTATETDDAFETANERDTTESEGFQTGAESIADDSSDELTETESRGSNLFQNLSSTPRIRTPFIRSSSSFMSSASSDEDDFELHTPIQAQPPRYRLKMSRSRRGRPFGEIPLASSDSVSNSPASSMNVQQRTPSAVGVGQSLFAELDALDGGSDREFGTPGRSDRDSVPPTPSHKLAPSAIEAPVGRPLMIDASIMTEPLEPVVQKAHEKLEFGASFITSLDVAPVNAVPRQIVLQASSGLYQVDTAPVQACWKSIQFATAHASALGTAPIEVTRKLPNIQLSPVSSVHTTPILPIRSMFHIEMADIISVETMPVSVTRAAPELMQVAMSDVKNLDTVPVAEIRKREDSRLPVPVPVGSPQKPPPGQPRSVYFDASAINETSTEPGKAFIKSVPQLPSEIFPLPSFSLGVSGSQSMETSPISMKLREPPSQTLGLSSAFFIETSPITAKISPPCQRVFGVSAIPSVDTSPILVKKHVPDPPTLGVSIVDIQEIQPVVPLPIPKPASLQLQMSSVLSENTIPVPVMFAIPAPQISSITTEATLPVEPVWNSKYGLIEPGNGETREPVVEDKVVETDVPGTPKSVDSVVRITPPVVEYGVQTILTSQQIDRLLMDRETARAATAAAESSAKRSSSQKSEGTESASPSTPKAKTLHPFAAVAGPTKRPGSAGSQTNHRTANYPPLPPDHKDIIAAAQRMSSVEASPPPVQPSTAPSTPGTMGPPLAPASAYRTNQQRPRTPVEQNDGGNTLKQKNVTINTPRTAARRESQGQSSRRSSMSSFASELDVRFNLQRDEFSQDGQTDPRMIQAITQTMIGEFLFKYTRKPGRADIGSSRHQRYVWVHPYTRTLYWSEHSPTASFKTQKSKSLIIEAVRVVNDDNPYPPGLHRKSLEIISPGRVVKFTAATGQRHETWYNALSYLLLRTSDVSDQNEPLNGEADSFNPSLPNSSRRSRVSSRASRQSKYSVAGSHNQPQSQPPMETPSLPSLPSRPRSTTPFDTVRSSSRISHISNMLRSSGMGGTFGSRRSRHGPARASLGSTDDKSHGSTDDREDLGADHEHVYVPGPDGLENVRACCDGKLFLNCGR